MTNKILMHYGLVQDDVLVILRENRDSLKNEGDGFSRNVATRLLSFEHAFRDSESAMSLKNTIENIGTIVRDPNYLVEQQTMLDANPNVHFSIGLPPEAYEWGRQFISEIITQVREVVCGNNKEYEGLRTQYNSFPKAFAVATSATIMQATGVSSPMALGLCTLVLLTISQATKTALCKMTDEDVLQAIDLKVKEELQGERESVARFDKIKPNTSGDEK